ncbi:hypothetical protein RhiirA1_533288 [Rhizophagus irregularis]|uniref:TRP C-terminal domain-containing protein n=1 Tax=Rhizophagus irregularis TaxID=588596 RepID=A0A2N0S273_9GLOM|nr:hypothetical protein RhiirA1_533288 [Rhizophagus irregularis]
MSRLRRVNLFFYVIILLSFYAIQVLSNPISEKPTPTLQKRQEVITSTTFVTTTDDAKVVTITTYGPQSMKTFSPSKPKNCIGLVKFTNIQLVIMKDTKLINFIVKGKTSMNDLNSATVKTSIYWDNKHTAESISPCPMNNTCEIQYEQSTIIFNYTTSLPEEFLDSELSGRNAYLTLSVVDENGKVLGCVTTSCNGIVTDLIPYLFNIPLICGSVAAVFCIAAKNRKKEHDECEKKHDEQHDGHDSHDRDEIHKKHDGHDSHDRDEIHKKHDGHDSHDRNEIHKNHENHSTQRTHPSSQGELDPENPQSTPYSDPNGNLQPTSQSTPYSDPSGNLQPTSSGNKFPTGASYDPTKSTTPAHTPITQHPPSSNNPPSIYDIIRVAQFFVTTALISLPGIPYGYRDVISKLGWAIGLPSNNVFNISYLSNIADEQVRGGICRMVNFCSNLIKSPVAYNSDSTCADIGQPTPSSKETGLTSFGKLLDAPDYNLFFIAFISFCFTLGVALVIVLLIWLFAWSCKKLQTSLWKKWSFLKKAVDNLHLLILGGFIRALILFYYPITLFAFYQLALIKDCWLFIFLAVICVTFLSLGAMAFCGYKILRPYFFENWDEYKKPTYTIFYSSLYSQYHEEEDKSSNCVWFFVFTTTYDFLRAIIIGLGQRSAIAQIIGLLVTEAIFFFLIVKYKPYKSRMIQWLKTGISIVQFVVVILLIPFFGNTPLVYRIVIDYIMKSMQFILTILIFSITIVTLYIVIRNLINGDKGSKNDEKDDDDDKREIIGDKN